MTSEDNLDFGAVKEEEYNVEIIKSSKKSGMAALERYSCVTTKKRRKNMR